MSTTVIRTKAVQSVSIVRNRGPYRLVTGGQGPAGANGNVGKMFALTQTEYEALDPPDAGALYIIVPDE